MGNGTQEFSLNVLDKEWNRLVEKRLERMSPDMRKRFKKKLKLLENV